jgi:thioredoxin 1
MLPKLFSALLLILLFGCSESPKGTQDSASPKDSSVLSSSGNPSLVFFLDPNGRPCQIQDEILRGMSGDLQGVVELRYVQTTVPSDINVFYAFGVRGLPTLLLTDASGKEIRRLPPGVKSAEEIRTLLQAIPAR